jgi:Lysyl oxidase
MGVNLVPEVNDFWVERLRFEPQNTENPTPGAVRNGSVEERCITEGTHKILSFVTEVNNRGDKDLVIGRPEDHTDIFERVRHTRNGWITKENFYTYALKDKAGNILSKGSKRAWCIMDHSRFNCDYQGISKGDHDEYGTQEHCQFLVIDDLSNGEYVFEAVINPFKIFEEVNYEDNKVTIVIRIEEPLVEIIKDKM